MDSFRLSLGNAHPLTHFQTSETEQSLKAIHLQNIFKLTTIHDVNHLTVKSGDYDMAFDQYIGTMGRESSQVCLKKLECRGIIREC